MSDCPSCDFANVDLGALLRRIDDRGLLITLACDFVERVVYRTPDPTQARAWLQATRLWREYPGAASDARKAAAKAATAPIGLETRGDAPAAWEATRAVWAATATADAEKEITATVSEALWSAMEAAKAATDFSSEREWQLAHAKELACNCPFIPEVGQIGPRGRNSLLTQ